MASASGSEAKVGENTPNGHFVNGGGPAINDNGPPPPPPENGNPDGSGPPPPGPGYYNSYPPVAQKPPPGGGTPTLNSLLQGRNNSPGSPGPPVRPGSNPGQHHPGHPPQGYPGGPPGGYPGWGHDPNYYRHVSEN